MLFAIVLIESIDNIWQKMSNPSHRQINRFGFSIVHICIHEVAFKCYRGYHTTMKPKQKAQIKSIGMIRRRRLSYQTQQCRISPVVVCAYQCCFSFYTFLLLLCYWFYFIELAMVRQQPFSSCWHSLRIVLHLLWYGSCYWSRGYYSICHSIYSMSSDQIVYILYCLSNRLGSHHIYEIWQFFSSVLLALFIRVFIWLLLRLFSVFIFIFNCRFGFQLLLLLNYMYVRYLCRFHGTNFMFHIGCMCVCVFVSCGWPTLTPNSVRSIFLVSV